MAHPDAPGAYEEQARHLASLVWKGEPPESLADYLASGGVATDARPRMARAELVSLARAITRLAAAEPPA